MKISRKDLLSSVIDGLTKCTTQDQFTFDMEDSVTKVYASGLYRRVAESASTRAAKGELSAWTPADWAGALVDTMTPVAEGADELEVSSTEDAVEQVVADALSMSSVPTDQLAAMDAATAVAGFKLAPEIADSEWSDQAQADLKSKLKAAKDAGDSGIDAIIQSVYASCDPNDATTWKYPYRSTDQDQSLLVNPQGVEKAIRELVARDPGSRDSKLAVAHELLAHAPTHPILSAVAEAKPGIQMVTLEILRPDESVVTLMGADTETGRRMCVAESAANLLRDLGMLKVDGPTVIQIDEDQLAMVHTNLTDASKTLMGELGGVAESAPSPMVDLKIVEELATAKKLLGLAESKVDALHGLLSSSPLKGVAESIAGAESLEAVTAFKSVSESVGIKRLITARRAQQVIATETDAEVAESGGNFEQLSHLLAESEKGRTAGGAATPALKNRLSMYI